MPKKPFELDPLVASQFFETVGTRASKRSGETRLLIAVLRDAIDCFQYCIFTDNPNVSRLSGEAEQWIMGKSEPSDTALTFEYVCSVLDLDPDYLRSGLRRWRDASVAQRQRKSLR